MFVLRFLPLAGHATAIYITMRCRRKKGGHDRSALGEGAGCLSSMGRRQILMRAVRISLAGLGAAAALVGGTVLYALWVPGSSFSGRPPALTALEADLAQRLKRHIVAVASEPHNVLHADALERSAVAIEAAFRDYGFEPKQQTFETDGATVRNIWVTIEPEMPATRSIVVGAHYDSAGESPGANDNGSGTASVIELARLLADYRPKATRIFLVAFVNEEAPYWGGPDHGAFRFVQLLKERQENVVGMLSLETMGWFSDKPGSQTYPFPFNLIYSDKGNFLAFVGMPGSRSFLHEVIGHFRQTVTVPTIGGIAPEPIPGIAWSDHKAFADHGIPALMLTDTAPFRYPHYHKLTDTPDKVDTDTLARITSALNKTIRALAR